MKKNHLKQNPSFVIIMVIMVCVLSTNVQAQVEPVHETLTKNEIFSKIDTEHKNTRKYISDEMTRQRNEFYKDIDDRGAYYEREANDMLTYTFWKLALIWGGMLLFIVSLTNILRLKIESARFKKLQKFLLDGLTQDIYKRFGMPNQDQNLQYKQNLGKDFQPKVDEMINEKDKHKFTQQLEKAQRDKKDSYLDKGYVVGDGIRI